MKETKQVSKLRPAEYSNAKLSDSHWKKQFDDTVEYYLAIPNDSLLKPFRKRAGLPAPGQGLAGWYGFGGGSFGQKLAAFAKMYRATGDSRLKEKALYLTYEWMKCADKEPELLKQGTYSFDKIIGGLIDVYEYLGVAKALDYVEKLTNEAIKNFKSDIKRQGIQDEELVRNNMIEWYTMPENLFRAYGLTGNEKYRDFALVWDYDYLWDKVLKGDLYFGSRHAYSHVNSLSSAAQAYIATEDEKYLKVIEAAYKQILSEHTFATGGYGPAESIFTKEGYLGNSLLPTWGNVEKVSYVHFGGGEAIRDDVWGSCEIPCCAWATYKICNYLMMLTGKAEYGDWAEKMLYNGTGAQLPVGPNGKIMYYASYFVDGALKSVDDRRLGFGGSANAWQCCTGTFPQDVAEYYNMLYYFDDDGIYVNQYLPSKTAFMIHGRKVEVENFSKYPEESQLKFTFNMEDSAKFSFRFRVPSWLKEKAVLKLNGIDLQVDCQPNQWAVIDRTWADGDVLSIEFPFHLYFEAVDKEHPEIAALKYGPLVLATDGMCGLIGDINKPEEWIHPVDSGEMEFITDEGHVGAYEFETRTFKPYYKIGAMEWYYVYSTVKKELERRRFN